jgi:sulfate/thiosulfate transport system substrate-binding protein
MSLGALGPNPSRSLSLLSVALLGATLAGCGGGGAGDAKPAAERGSSQSPGDEPAAAAVTSITLGAYTTPREAYGKAVLPAFKRRWKEQAGAEIEFKESYLGSGAQARAIIGGFEADVAALSLEPDIEKLRAAGLITHDWKAGEHAGMVTRSIVVIGVRKGNPKNIEDWDDLARPGVEVLTPDVRTSGGAMWNVAAIYGAALRGQTKAPKDDKAAAAKLLGAVLKNVKILDKGARESLLNFERGVGDAIITYENEILVGKMKGQDYEYVIPKSTILIENPIALIDAYADKRGSRGAATAFLAFVRTPEAQRAFAEYGLRPVSSAVANEVATRFPAVTDLFTIRDLGDWAAVQKDIFDKGAAYDLALQAAQGALQ